MHFNYINTDMMKVKLWERHTMQTVNIRKYIGQSRIQNKMYCQMIPFITA